MPAVSPPPSPSSATDRTDVQRRLLAALACQIEPVRKTPGYWIAALGVASVMLLLPLLYLVLLTIIGHTIYWWAVHQQWILERRHATAVALYVGPMVVGGVVLLFLVKPLFARRAKDTPPLRLSRDAEPFLYEYVTAVARAVGAPPPRSIRINCDVNASASFRRGWMSLFSDDMVVQVGLPVVEGMTVRQLTGILAHEFGHFAQRSGMRLDYIIRHINVWFVRVACERDAYDQWMMNAIAALGVWGWLIGLAVHAAVWITQSVLFSLAWLGSAVGCVLSRQSEFDADRYEVRLVGVAAFTKSFRQMRELGLARKFTENDLGRFWQEGRLPDDYASLVVSNIPSITPEIRRKLRQLERQHRSGLFDTHPPDRDRVSIARQESGEGAIRLPDSLGDLSATVLFRDFRKISRAASIEYYRTVLGDQFDPKQLHSSSKLIDSRNQEVADREALARYFQTEIPLLRPLPVAEDAGQRPAKPTNTAEQLKEARAAMLAALPGYKELCPRHDEAEATLFRCLAAEALVHCKLPIQSADYRLANGKSKTIAEKLRRTREALNHLAAKMLPFETDGGTRMSCAMRLLHLDKVVNRIPDGENLQREIARLLPEAQFISRKMAELLPLRLLTHRLMVLMSATKENEDRPRLIDAVFETMGQLHDQLQVLQDELEDHYYPFDHADATMTLKRFALPELPPKDNPFALYWVGGEAAQRLMLLQLRLFARLAFAAEKVESALGMPPLPQPRSNEADDE